MSVDENKAIIRAFVETVWNGRQLDRADELVAADFVDHAPMPGQAPGLEGVKRKGAIFSDGISDFRITIEGLVAEGDKVAVRRTYGGTHRGGPLLGIPATGKRFQFGGISIFRVANGRLVQPWEQLDRVGVMEQAGVVPVP